MDDDWIDSGTYWLHRKSQLTSSWFEERSYRLTTTHFSSLINPSFWKGRDDVIRHYKGTTAKRSLQEQMALDGGILNEPKAREWYCQTYQQEVKEVGFAVPKWDSRIGCSVDGVVEGTNGIIEIKCSSRMYTPITKYLDARNQGWRPQKHDYAHIYRSHYDQMQGSMAIMDKEWCDYIVYCLSENSVFTQRVRCDSNYWATIMYPVIKTFLEEETELFNQLKAKYLRVKGKEESISHN